MTDDTMPDIPMIPEEEIEEPADEGITLEVIEEEEPEEEETAPVIEESPPQDDLFDLPKSKKRNVNRVKSSWRILLEPERRPQLKGKQ